MSGFDSLTAALEGRFELRLEELPEALRQRVEKDLSPLPWDELSVDQRRHATQQCDYQHDPSTEDERLQQWDLLVHKWDLERKIEKWKAVATPNASDLAEQEGRLSALQEELAYTKNQLREKQSSSSDGLEVGSAEWRNQIAQSAANTRHTTPHTPSTVRREARKLRTNEMREQWRREYRELKNRQPNKSDLWCARQIAKLDIAQGRNHETIRKHMKQ